MGKIYNINLQDNFIKKVSAFILKNISAVKLPEYTIILPNNRSCREFKRLLLFSHPQINDSTFVLPKIASISDEIIFDDHKIAMIIMSVMRKNNARIPVNTMFELSVSVAKLIKELIINDISFAKIRDFVPDNLTEFWRPTITILEHCINDPQISKAIELAKLNIRVFLESIVKNHRKIIAVGIGNTNQYTKKFMKAIYESDSGIIFTLSNKNSRNEVCNKEILGTLPQIDISDAFLEEDSNSINHNFAEFSEISDEALAIAIAVRKSIYEHKSVLIVAPNTDLAARIKTELLRWNIFPDDSYGTDFAKTRTGILISLILDSILSNFQTAATLQIFKSSKIYSEQAENLELSLKLSGEFFPDFFDAVKNISEGCDNNRPDEDLIKCIYEFRQELISQKILDNTNLNTTQRSFAQWTDLILALIAIVDNDNCSSEKFSEIMSDYVKYSDFFLDMSLNEYSIFLKKHCLKTSLRHSLGYTNGVFMLGIIESQLLEADFIIIAGANEESFASMDDSQNDFWFTKSLMKTIGIPTAEDKNRFVQCIFERLACKQNVLITRSERVKGVQQIKYSMIDEVKNLKKDNYFRNFVDSLKRKRNQKWEEKEGTEIKSDAIKLPSPNPDLRYRPSQFSITDIEQLKNNAYAFYARKILRLKELNDLTEVRNLRGNFMHNVLDNFVKFGSKADICAVAHQTMRAMHLNPNQFGMWFFQMSNIFSFIQKNQNNNCKSFSEIHGECILNITPGYSCSISCKADRLDIDKSNKTISIIDYKTSSSNKITKKDVDSGKTAQLPIEAWIAANNGFAIQRGGRIQSRSVVSLQYWFLNKESSKTAITDCEDDTNNLVEKTLEGVKKLIRQYNVDKVPYNVNINYKYDKDYMHLARLKEWLNAR